MENNEWVRVTGPLAGHAAGLAGYLRRVGYPPSSVCRQLELLARLSSYLEERSLDVAGLTSEVMADFLHGADSSERIYGRVVRNLRSVGALAENFESATQVGQILAGYRAWLVSERSLAPGTVWNYCEAARFFALEHLGGDIDALRGLRASDVSAAVRNRMKSYSPRTVNEFVVGLRSFLRYLYLSQLVDTPLAQAVPWLAQARSSSLPRELKAGQAEALLSSCDTSTLVGARDFAVLTILVRLGLRRGEVARLELSDIDWRAGEIFVHGKGGSFDVLPLPVDVGTAIVAYLESRGKEPATRSLFCHVRPPRGAVTPTDVSAIVRRACERADIMPTGTHRLRHAMATEMLRRGAPLYEIGQVLRHRDLETTSIYAKVDRASLATIARPWPGSSR
jgi:integrase/recombinase XerD